MGEVQCDMIYNNYLGMGLDFDELRLWNRPLFMIPMIAVALHKILA